MKHRIRRMEALLERCIPTPTDEIPGPPRRLETPQDLVDLLQEQIRAVAAAPWTGTLQKAQAIGVLAGILRKVMELNKVACRLEMLEAVLKGRRRNDS